MELWDPARVSLKGPLKSAWCCCWVWFHLADLLLLSLLFAVDAAKNRLMTLACSQEAAMSSVTWPPSRSHFAAGSSCLLLKTDFEWGFVRALVSALPLTQPSCCLNLHEPPSLAVQQFLCGVLLGSCAGEVHCIASPSCPCSASSQKHSSLLFFFNPWSPSCVLD